MLSSWELKLKPSLFMKQVGGMVALRPPQPAFPPVYDEINVCPFELPPANDLDYPLPETCIAKRPAEPRDASLLLVSDASSLSSTADTVDTWVFDGIFRELPSFLPAKSLLVLNRSRVITARLLMRKEGTGGKAEVLCISPVSPSWDPAIALTALSNRSVWRCMIGGRNIKAGSRLVLTTENGLCLTGQVEAREGKDGLVRFSWTHTAHGKESPPTFGDVLEDVGKIPLPPYMNRASDTADLQDYQTVYATARGSVAAPTAGLHFTHSLLQQLRNGPQQIETCYLTLHVGAGTFQPVTGKEVGEHAMHWERIQVPMDALETLIEATGSGRPMVPVGTTSVRTLETLYWWGVRLLSALPSSCSAQRPSTLLSEDSVTNLSLGQWDAYHYGAKWLTQASSLVPAVHALEALRDRAKMEGVDHVGGETQLMIAPGYRFALCDGLITNFHQPRSTLLLLVGAFLGGLGPVHRIYRHALSKGSYRFLSFGDSNLMIPPARVILPVRPKRGNVSGKCAVAWPRKGWAAGVKEERWVKLPD